MSFDDLLIDVCNILRYTSTQDDYGQSVKTWAALYSDQPCRLSTPQNREIQSNMEVVIVDKTLFLDDSVDVTEQDRVESAGITYEILSVGSYRSLVGNHKELLLRTVR